MVAEKAKKKSSPTIITIRLTSKADAKVIETIKLHFGIKVASKALMRAAEKYPPLVEENKDLKRSLSRAKYQLVELRQLISDKCSLDEKFAAIKSNHEGRGIHDG